MAAVVAGPIVSISPTMPPEALSRLISPALFVWLSTSKVCVPVAAELQPGAQSDPVTLTVVVAAACAAGSAAIVAPAATAGTMMSTPATVHGRRPAVRCQRPATGSGCGSGSGFGAPGLGR